MKKLFTILSIFTFCIACQKNDPQPTENSVEYDPTTRLTNNNLKKWTVTKYTINGNTDTIFCYQDATFNFNVNNTFTLNRVCPNTYESSGTFSLTSDSLQLNNSGNKILELSDEKLIIQKLSYAKITASINGVSVQIDDKNQELITEITMVKQ